MKRRTTYGAAMARMATDVVTRRISMQFIQDHGMMIGALSYVLDDIRREAELCALNYDELDVVP